MAGTSPRYAPTERLFSTLLEAKGIFQGEHEGQGRKRSDPLDLAQELGFWVMLFRNRFQLSEIVIPDTLCQRADLLEEGPKGRPKRIGYVLRRFVVEAHRRAFGQPSSEGLDRSSNVVYKLRAATDQRLTRADYGHVRLALFAPVLERIQKLRIEARQAGEVLGVYLVGLSLV